METIRQSDQHAFSRWCTGGLQYYLDYIDNLRKVSRQDLYDYVNTYIKGKPCITGVLLNQSAQEQLNIGEAN